MTSELRSPPAALLARIGSSLSARFARAERSDFPRSKALNLALRRLSRVLSRIGREMRAFAPILQRFAPLLQLFALLRRVRSTLRSIPC